MDPTPKAWAHIGQDLPTHLLRRGAWYPIAQISDSIVVLDANGHMIPIDRRYVDIRNERPNEWSVVHRHPTEAVASLFPKRYAVCPQCRNRQAFDPTKNELTCEGCGFTTGLNHQW